MITQITYYCASKTGEQKDLKKPFVHKTFDLTDWFYDKELRPQFTCFLIKDKKNPLKDIESELYILHGTNPKDILLQQEINKRMVTLYVVLKRYLGILHDQNPNRKELIDLLKKHQNINNEKTQRVDEEISKIFSLQNHMTSSKNLIKAKLQSSKAILSNGKNKDQKITIDYLSLFSIIYSLSKDEPLYNDLFTRHMDEIDKKTANQFVCISPQKAKTLDITNLFDMNLAQEINNFILEKNIPILKDPKNTESSMKFAGVVTGVAAISMVFLGINQLSDEERTELRDAYQMPMSSVYNM